VSDNEQKKKTKIIPAVEDQGIADKYILVLEVKKGEKKFGQEILDQCFIITSKMLYSDLFYLVIVVILSILFSVPATLIPMKNAIHYPSHWWDIIIPANIGSSLYMALNTVLELKLVFKFEFVNYFKPFIRLYATVILSAVIPFCGTHLIWTVCLGYNYPLPFVGFVIYFFWYGTHFVALWFLFPYELRVQKDVRNRILKYFFYRLWFMFYGNQQLGLKIMMDKIPLTMQWVMAIIFPLQRELNLWVLSKLLEKSIDLRNTTPLIPKLTATISVNIVHAFFIALVISSQATAMTSYCILAVEFLLNLYSSY